MRRLRAKQPAGTGSPFEGFVDPDFVGSATRRGFRRILRMGRDEYSPGRGIPATGGL